MIQCALDCGVFGFAILARCRWCNHIQAHAGTGERHINQAAQFGLFTLLMGFQLGSMWYASLEYVHHQTSLTADQAHLYADTSGEPLFKRGWREDKGDAPLKETLAAAMIAATGWNPHGPNPQPLYDPCCGSGTIGATTCPRPRATFA